MAIQLRRVDATPGIELLVALFNRFKRETVQTTTSYPHVDITAATSGVERPPGQLVATALAVAGTTTTLALVAILAEHARSVMLQHFGDDIAHLAADSTNTDGITFMALPPIVSTSAPMPATVTGSGATYAAVTAGHTLTLNINGREYVATFAGTENTQALYHAAINAAIGSSGGIVPGRARNAGGETMLYANAVKGGSGLGSVVAGSTDVLASLGLTAGTAFSRVAVVTASQGAVDTLLEALAAAQTAHLSQSGVHAVDDSTNVLTSAAATDLASSELRAADIKAMVNAHILFGPTTPSIKIVNA